jgi:carbon-monoxide dehydrogenase large subunit
MGVQAVGASVNRMEDPRLLRGEAAFVDDLRFSGLLHMAVLRSPHAHARVLSVDVSAARQLTGVADAFSAADLGTEPPAIPALFSVEGFRPAPQYPLATDTVRFVGEPVAVVVAESRHVAEDALELIEVDYEPLEAVVDAYTAIQPGAPVLHANAPDNVAATMVHEAGDVESAFAAADRVIRERLDMQRYTGIPMETRGVVAQRDPITGEMTVWNSTQWPHTVRTLLAGMLGVPARSVRVITPDIGGGFGVKADFNSEDFLVPFAAGRVHRPVKWIEDRNEHFLSIAHSREQIHEVEIAVRNDGTMLGLRARHITDCGAYQRPLGLVNASLAATSLGGVYRVPAYRVEAVCASTNKAPASPYRGAGAPEATFARERLLDIVARELGVDRAELRRKNLLTPEEMPHDTGLASLEAAVVLDSGNFPAGLEKALEMIDYAGFAARQQVAREQGRLVGLGICVYHQITGPGPFEGGSVRVDPTGEVTINSGAAPQGQGTATMLAQIAAVELQVPHDSIKVVFGDTGRLAHGMGTYASRNAVMAGSSVVMAARKVREKAEELAAHLLEADPSDLVLEDGAFSVKGVPASTVSWADVATAASPGGNRPADMEPDLESVQYFESLAAPYSYGIHIAEAEVDPHTGYTTVTRYVVVNDAGTIVNPRNAEGQIVGGVAQGLGGALMEELVYAPDGQPQSTSFMDYLVPGSLDVPDVEIGHLESRSPLNPLGVKGMGEGGAIGGHTAVANAVADAIEHLGVRVTRTPLKPATVWQLLQSAAAPA